MKELIQICIGLGALLSFTAVSEEPRRAPLAKDAKVYQTDKYGNVQYHKPSYAVQPDGKIMEVDPYGNRMQQQYEIKGNQVYTTDKFGNRLESSFVVKDNKVHRTDKYGNVQHHEPSHTIQPDGKVMKVDAYGKRQQQSYEIKSDRQGRTDAVNGKSSPESAQKQTSK